MHKNKIYGKIQFIKGNYNNLFNISDNIFGAKKKDVHNIIYFFSHDTFQFIKSININNNFDIIGVIKSQLLCIQDNSNYNLIFIDLNNLEIVIIKENIINFKEIKILDNHIFYFSIQNGILKIKKEILELDEGHFKVDGLIEKKINFNYYSKFLVTDNGYIIIYDNNNLCIFK